MDFSVIQDIFSLENFMQLINDYRSFGPLIGILLPLIEAFLPFLPLFVFVMANASAYGLGLGFLYSWIGATLGALLVFFLVRKYGQKRFLTYLKKNGKVEKIVNWVDGKGFGLLFLLLCFPFTPSSVVNVVAGLSKISIYQYGLAVIIGKMVMIFTVSFIGHDIPSLIQNPGKSVFVAILIFVLWFVGKRLESGLNSKVEKETEKKIENE